MTPKEKARELRDKMYLKIPSVYDPTGLPHYPIAKEMALISVKEQICLLKNLDDRWHSSEENKMTAMFDIEIEYWEDIKNEIEKL